MVIVIITALVWFVCSLINAVSTRKYFKDHFDRDKNGIPKNDGWVIIAGPVGTVILALDALLYFVLWAGDEFIQLCRNIAARF